MNQIIGGAEWTDNDYEVGNVTFLMQYAQESENVEQLIQISIIWC